MESPIKGRIVKKVEYINLFAGYANDGSSTYKDALLVTLEPNLIDSDWLTIEQWDLFNHLIQRIEKLEEQNKLLCKALGIRRSRVK